MTTTTRQLQPVASADAAHETYLHLAVEPPRSGRGTDQLRELVTEIGRPLEQILTASGASSARLFRDARLDQLGEQHHELAGRDNGIRYDISLFLGLAHEDQGSELLDHDAMREVLDILYARGQQVTITPARNVGPRAQTSGQGRLNLIRHLRADGTPDVDGVDRAASWNRWEYGLVQRESLIPTDPASTPFLRIDRSELDAARSRSLVVALARSRSEPELATTHRGLRDLYWELPLGRRDVSLRSTPQPTPTDFRRCSDEGQRSTTSDPGTATAPYRAHLLDRQRET